MLPGKYTYYVYIYIPGIIYFSACLNSPQYIRLQECVENPSPKAIHTAISFYRLSLLGKNRLSAAFGVCFPQNVHVSRV